MPLVNKQIKKTRHTPLYIASIEKFRLHAPVPPDSTVRTTVTLTKDFTRIAMFDCVLQVGATVVATGKIIMSSALDSKQI
jgi:3-hydroxymyristoyl/3-hydroxydecanoyl-(acyl carrier protein) dehydratase